jgi:uncharacterized protein YjbJ (UPF0337 family)
VGGKTEQAKGRIKQVIGALSGNEKRKRNGRHDERAGRTKQKVDEAIDGIRDKL